MISATCIRPRRRNSATITSCVGSYMAISLVRVLMKCIDREYTRLSGRMGGIYCSLHYCFHYTSVLGIDSWNQPKPGEMTGMRMLSNLIGDRGENIFELAITDYREFARPLFKPGFLGDKWPAVDYYVELVGVEGSTPFFFAQIKTT